MAINAFNELSDKMIDFGYHYTFQVNFKNNDNDNKEPNHSILVVQDVRERGQDADQRLEWHDCA